MTTAFSAPFTRAGRSNQHGRLGATHCIRRYVCGNGAAAPGFTSRNTLSDDGAIGPPQWERRAGLIFLPDKGAPADRKWPQGHPEQSMPD
jgi:hypothetical protein